MSSVLLPLDNQAPHACNPCGTSEQSMRWLRVSRNVFLLGMTSLFTDLSSEMISAVLPLYLTVELKFTPFQFGAFDGFYQAVTAPVRIVGGVLADRYRRYQEVASVGYGLSALCKIGLFAAGGAWRLVMIFLFLDRVAKGVRTAPRDALIVLSSAQQTRAEAFGVHRAFDTIGALLGPLVAFGLLGFIPNGFDVVFLVSFCLAVIGVGIVTLLVKNPDQFHHRNWIELRGGGHSSMELLCSRSFRVLLFLGILLSAATISDGFIYLTLQHRVHLGSHFFPLLSFGTALASCIWAIPMGRIADYIGRGRVFWGGHLLLGGAYGVLLLPSLGLMELIICLTLLGAFYAATDGVLAAIGGSVIPQQILTSGLALLTTAMVVARFLSSLVFGSLWAWGGSQWAVAIFGASLLAALVLSLRTFAMQAEFTRT
jgi:MFS family permease